MNRGRVRRAADGSRRHNGPGNEGTETGAVREATFGGEVDDQRVAFITLLMITVLPSTATTSHPRDFYELLELQQQLLFPEGAGHPSPMNELDLIGVWKNITLTKNRPKPVFRCPFRQY